VCVCVQAQVTINRVPNIAKIFALKQYTADDTKKSKADNFRDPNLEQVCNLLALLVHKYKY
jgi:hypothetical protein